LDFRGIATARAAALHAILRIRNATVHVKEGTFVFRYRVFILLVLLAVAPAATPSISVPGPASSDRQRETVRSLSHLIQELMRRSAVPGLSVALIENRKTVWIGNFGVKNLQRPDPVSGDTVFEAASMSKPVFAYAVLKLVDQGKFNLDTPLSHYLPAYVKNDDRISLITARLVLTHRTGFPNWRRAGPLTIHFRPGDKFSYSGEGFVYLQRTIEKITGLTLNEFVRRNVFIPLEMKNSSYEWRPSFDKQAAWGHDVQGTPGDRYDFGIAGHRFPWKDSAPNAAATLITSASDYARFVIAIMNGSGLKCDIMRAMLSPQSQVDSGCYSCIDVQATHPDKIISWGLGIGLERTARDRYFWQWGDNNGFKAFMMGSPKSGSGLVILTNSDHGMEIIPDIVAAATGQTQPLFDWLQYKH